MRLRDIVDRIRLPFRKEKELFSAICRIVGFYPRNIALYKQALRHKSTARYDNKQHVRNDNERLEFLGDAVLDAIVGHIVYEHFSNKQEGFLTNTRSKLVSREMLGKISRELGVSRLVTTKDTGHSHNSYMAGNAMEALVGAIYLDRGYELTAQFVKERMYHGLSNIDKVAKKEVNFKSKVLEWSQKNHVAIEFRMLDQTVDDDGSPMFVCRIFIEDQAVSQGRGYSKKEAHQNAAKSALRLLKADKELTSRIMESRDMREGQDKTEA